MGTTGEDLVPAYLTLVKVGESDSPEALLKPLGVDIHDPKFWQMGFDEIRGLVKRMEGLVDKELEISAKNSEC